MKLLLTIALAFVVSFAKAQNPYLPLWEFIPDGEPYVFEDPDNPGKYRVYIYGSHDMLEKYYCGKDLVTWSAPVEDLSKWRYDGVIFESKTDAKGKVTLTPPIGATVRFITKMIEEDPYSDNVTETADIKEVVITKELIEQSGIKTIVFGNTEEKTFDVVEQMPEFPGGASALLDYLNKNVCYPKQAFDAGIEGRVIVTFVVGKDGSVRNAKVVKSVDPALDNEALRVINAMPKWTPGRQSGKEVAVKYTVPISFHLQGDDKPQAEGTFTPTAEGNIQIRYAGTTKDPLFIVDGVKTSAEKVKAMDPKTIERMDVLKDKSAIEKYGDKAKDGVILITTKKK